MAGETARGIKVTLLGNRSVSLYVTKKNERITQRYQSLEKVSSKIEEYPATRNTKSL
jgi:hypothetical protein